MQAGADQQFDLEVGTWLPWSQQYAQLKACRSA